eukprot:3490896-Prymnesium_polylepis.2
MIRSYHRGRRPAWRRPTRHECHETERDVRGAVAGAGGGARGGGRPARRWTARVSTRRGPAPRGARTKALA